MRSYVPSFSSKGFTSFQFWTLARGPSLSSVYLLAGSLYVDYYMVDTLINGFLRHQVVQLQLCQNFFRYADTGERQNKKKKTYPLTWS